MKRQYYVPNLCWCYFRGHCHKVYFLALARDVFEILESELRF